MTAAINSFDSTVEGVLTYLEQVEGTLILVVVSDNRELRERAAERIRQSLPAGIKLHDFRYDPEHLSFLEGVSAAASQGGDRAVVSVTGLDELPRDKRTEAIRLLNSQRNQFGRTDLATILWVGKNTLAEISNRAADFYSWRSKTFFLKPPPGWNELRSAWRNYLRAVVRWNEFVNLQGLAPVRGGHIVQMRMEDIFIPLRVSQEPSSRFALFETLSPSQKGSASLPSPPNLQPERPKLTELLRERRAVVLGDPGAGKTTLLRYIAHTLARAQVDGHTGEAVGENPELAECLPVYVRVGEYAQHVQQNPEAALDDFALTTSQSRDLPLTAPLLEDAKARGRALFLFDGLDEVIETGLRREMARRVEAFALDNPQCRVLVTSRVVGYREAQLGAGFAQFDIGPFEDDEIRLFAERWYEALGKPENAASLVEALSGNPSIRRLASNPLLLTVIALIHWRGTRLPHHRAKLYSLAAETLVDQWMSHRRVQPEGWDAPETMHLLLPAIAWHLHQTTSSGLINEKDLHELLVRTLRRESPRLSAEQVQERATQFRRNVAEFSGIFLERGADDKGRGIYGFLHLTFEEFFTAACLKERWLDDRRGALAPLLHDPRWNEIILLTAGLLGDFSQSQATSFVQDILRAGSDYEEILHRDLLLAAQCLADDVRVGTGLREEILFRLLEIFFDARTPDQLRGDVGGILSRLGDATAGAELLEMLRSRLSDPEDETRIRAAGALSGMPLPPTKEVVSMLEERLSDSQWQVRQTAVTLLVKVAATAATPEVLNKLLKLLKDPNEKIRVAAVDAAGALSILAPGPRITKSLSKCLSDVEREVRFKASIVLAISEDKKLLHDMSAVFLKLAADDRWQLREAAAVFLSRQDEIPVNAELSSALYNLLTDPEQKVRLAAIEAVGARGREILTPEIISLLPTLIQGGVEQLTRTLTTKAFFTMTEGRDVSEVISALLSQLSDADPAVRSLGAVMAASHGQRVARPQVISALLKLLSDPDAFTRHAALAALGTMGEAAATPEVISALREKLSDPDALTREFASQTLGEMGQSAAGGGVMSSLLGLLSDGEPGVRGAAASALKRLSAHVRPQERAEVIDLLLPLARSVDVEQRDVCYVGLRNLLSTGRQQAA